MRRGMLYSFVRFFVDQFLKGGFASAPLGLVVPTTTFGAGGLNPRCLRKGQMRLVPCSSVAEHMLRIQKFPGSIHAIPS